MELNMQLPIPQLADKHLREIGLEEWQREDAVIADELKIVGKIMRKDIALSTMEALLHDALAYRKHYDLVNKQREEEFQ